MTELDQVHVPKPYDCSQKGHTITTICGRLSWKLWPTVVAVPHPIQGVKALW